jgi:hypothetical protein
MHLIIESLSSLGGLLAKVFVIVVSLMIVLEVFREFKVLDRLTSALMPFARIIGFKRDSIYPLIAGIIFGISYGGGILIGEARSGKVSVRQAFLIALFLGLCHAIFEDTLLFVSVGANGIVILVVRVSLAIMIVGGVAFLMKEKGY